MTYLYNSTIPVREITNTVEFVCVVFRVVRSAVGRLSLLLIKCFLKRVLCVFCLCNRLFLILCSIGDSFASRTYKYKLQLISQTISIKEAFVCMCFCVYIYNFGVCDFVVDVDFVLG